MVKPVDYVAFYSLMAKEAGFKFPPHMMPVAKGLEDSRIDKLQLIVPPGAGKSQTMSIFYPAFAIGNDPALTIIGVAAASHLVTGFVSAVMKIIEFDNTYHALFPGVLPDKNSGWSAERGIFVLGRPGHIPDASYLGVGIDSAAVEGKHARMIILDDIHYKDNASTAAACKAVIDRYHTTLLGRADPRGCRFISSGRRWNVDDAYGYFERSGDWVTMTLPAQRASSTDLWWDVKVPRDLECVFTEGIGQEVPCVIQNHRQFRVFYGTEKDGFYWPGMKGKKTEYFIIKRSSPAIAKSVYLCDPLSAETSIFRQEDIIAFHSQSSPPPPSEGFIVSSWDTAATTKDSSAYSAGLVAYLVPCDKWHNGGDTDLYGPCDPHFDVLIVDRVKEKFEFKRLYESMRSLHTKWGTSKVLIEEKSSGIDLASILPSVGLPIQKVKANRSKRDRIVQNVDGGIASVQGWFQMGRVSFWAETPWFDDLTNEILSFDGSSNQFSDQVDALTHLIAYAIKLSSASGSISVASGHQIDQTAVYSYSPLAQFVPEPVTKQEQMFQLFGNSMTCGTCKNHENNHYCSLKKIKCHIFFSCERWEDRSV